MNLKSFIYSLIALTSISCTNANIAGSDIYAILKGTVTDELGEPIEHMEITAHLQSSVFKLSKDLIDSIHEEGIVAYTS